MIFLDDGSVKQNKWASEIANKWIETFDHAIESNDARPESDGVAWFSDAIKCVKGSFVLDLSKMTAKQVIDNRKCDAPSDLLFRLANCGRERQLKLACKYRSLKCQN